MASSMLPPPSPKSSDERNFGRESDDEDADTASQRSISLSSPPLSKRNSVTSSDPRQSFATRSSEGSSSLHRDSTTLSGFRGIDIEEDDSVAAFSRRLMESEDDGFPSAALASSATALPSVIESTPREFQPVTYPPKPPKTADDAISISSFASTSSRKARPESLLIQPSNDPLILGVALVDFNHLVGPRIEYSRGDIFEDEEVGKILPFLALPDGAHLSAEDYSYFHLVKPGPNPTTIFGISCNQQISAASLLVKAADVTRSTVQKAVVVLASKPVFGPIREKLRVVTTALFHQRDFRDYSILDAFEASLEASVRSQLTESGLYMGTSLRELVHTFRQRTLMLVKALILQKRIMFFGYPVEKLCTFQYSLVSLLPGLLQTLDDCGSPPLASRALTLSRPTSLRTSDHKSMMAFMGLPLDVFGKDALFQPYLPLQQLDMLKDTPSWLCGCTNTIITQQPEIDMLVQTETGILEFRNPKLERLVALTAADRKWMDDILTDVHESWNEDDPTRPSGMHKFKGSDDYLRTKFEEYVTAALSTVKYQDFMVKGDNSGVIITGGTGGTTTSAEDFNPVWIAEFKQTNAYQIWDRVTDPLLFDLVEPRHPCTDKPSVVADIGLRLSEGIQDLKLEQQLAPAREAAARALTVGSTSFFKAVEGVRGRWAQRTSPSAQVVTDPMDKSSRASTPPVEVSKADVEDAPQTARQADYNNKPSALRPFSLTSTHSLSFGSPPTSPDAPGGVVSPVGQQISSWSAGLGSFFNSKAGRFSTMVKTPTTARPADPGGNEPTSSASGSISAGAVSGSGKMSSVKEDYGEPEGSPLFNGMSPGTSPMKESMGVPNIASVLKSKTDVGDKHLIPSAVDGGQVGIAQ
ncbi:transport protein Avl9-domain-containing protein [Crepidotus variabilis]|uniref:Transport protein Avl9-domain-containing protein n=1 Tax=Crepidotus variabilis TaxID=179855 RepID=A0A9P6EEI8_9AGAR|nr:transport protein Avl9-domain-containing protein [Crepidotus variabilis]